MAPSRRTGRPRFTLVLLVLASLTILTLGYRDSGPVSGLRNVAADVFSPIRSAGNAVARPFGNAFGSSSNAKLRKENAKLRDQVDQLKGDQMQSESALRQIEALKDQLAVRRTSQIPTTVGRIVSGPLTSFEATMEIDKGSGDGVRKGMAVVDKAGLVGRIVRVTGSRSTVALITDPTFKFGVRLAEQGNLAVAKGQGKKGTLVIDGGIAIGVSVKRGDSVVTSGEQGSPFPPDVNVGRVTSVGKTSDRTERVLTVQPLANLRGLTYVSVLLCDEDCS